METIQEENNAGEKQSPDPATLNMWKEFVGNTTLHGLRYVFLKRSKWVRVLWLALILTAAAYYSLVVVNAVQKYLARPTNTAIHTKYVKEMDFPAITICPLNTISRRKLYLRDEDEDFVNNGLNMSECVATAGVRGDRSCGVAILCCCIQIQIFHVSTLFPECTQEYRQQLISALNEHDVAPNTREFFHRFGTQLRHILSPWPICLFGVDQTDCTSADFDPVVNDYGMCFTFNSGRKKSVQRVKHHGITNGLSVMLDAQVSDYSTGKLSQGFKIIVHNQGEYVDEWSGMNVPPGSHATIATSRGEVTNLPAPYATKCKEKTLKQFPVYTREGCEYECVAETNLNKCGCRLPGYQVASTEDTRICSSLDENCMSNEEASLEYSSCGCEVPCSLVKYKTAISYSTFPSAAVKKYLDAYGYNWTEEYKRTNLVFLQVGYSSLSYKVQEQKPAYDSGALFGEIGGNMGLFLGCSLLTICEFVDFLAIVLMSRRGRRVLAV